MKHRSKRIAYLSLPLVAGLAFALVMAFLNARPPIVEARGGCKPGRTCVCAGVGACSYTCMGAGCAFECSGVGTCNFSCPKGGCTVNSAGTAATTLSCPGNGCRMTCAGTGSCTLTRCKKDCSVSCTGTGSCSNDCRDPSCR